MYTQCFSPQTERIRIRILRLELIDHLLVEMVASHKFVLPGCSMLAISAVGR